MPLVDCFDCFVFWAETDAVSKLVFCPAAAYSAAALVTFAPFCTGHSTPTHPYSSGYIFVKLVAFKWNGLHSHFYLVPLLNIVLVQQDKFGSCSQSSLRVLILLLELSLQPKRNVNSVEKKVHVLRLH